MRDGPAGQIGRGEERRAAHVAVRHAEATLLGDGEGDRRSDCAAAMVARRRRTAPFRAIGDEVGTEPLRRVRDGGKDDWLVGDGPTALSRFRALLGSDGHEASIVDRSYAGATFVQLAGDHENVARTRKNPGDDLFSRKAALSVSSALESLTSVFGMGTGVASPLESPGFSASGCVSAAGRRARTVIRARGADG